VAGLVVLGVFLLQTENKEDAALYENQQPLQNNLTLANHIFNSDIVCNEEDEFWSKSVILISIDGFRPDYLRRNITPCLQSLINDRAIVAPAMYPQFPSTTFPNHFSLVTGAFPVDHGIIHNEFYDPELEDTFSYKTKSMLDKKWWLKEPVCRSIHCF
jgi:predicted AlkP superfamily pyrophosphatase or phosphodiesterase